MESEITGCEFLGYSQYNKLPLVRLNTDDIYADEPPDEIMVCIQGKDEFYEFKKIPNCRMQRDDLTGAEEAYPVWYYKCSACGKTALSGESYYESFCPHCGAKVPHE